MFNRFSVRVNVELMLTLNFLTIGNVEATTEFNDASLIDDIWMQVLLSDPMTQTNGISIIADCTGLSSAILKWLIPKNCRVGAAKLESLPIKEWTIHVVNMGPIFKACIFLIKPFLRKTTIARVITLLFISPFSIFIH